MTNLLDELLHTLEEPQARYTELERYATGTQKLAFVPEASRKALDANLYRLAINIPALAVSALVERLRIVGFSNPRAWELFVGSDLDQLAAQAMSDALTYSVGFVQVWTRNGRTVASVESPRQCAVLADPADRSVLAGVKKYSTKTDTHAYVYLPDRTEHYVSDTANARSGFKLVDTVDNPTGIPILIPINNGRSEIDDLRGPVDALNKVILSMLVGVHRAGFGRSWVTGLELQEIPILDGEGAPVLDSEGEPVVRLVNPVDGDLSTMPMAIAEEPDTKFGSFNEPTLAGFETAVRVLISQIMSVSALPSHMLGVLTTQPTSADALRASEAGLTARAEQRQLSFGRSWEQVGRLLVAVDTASEVADTPMRVRWADASTRSTAQEIDAAQKALSSGLLSRRTILARLGMSDDEIEREIEEILLDAKARHEIALGTYL